ncbi:phosphorelay protein luxU [Vibrio ishigakensis]|uniref:Phosphorelay protein luxU n=1 Tax=Vibrio ishigakensis TaxID=1481914 RepID=A0A0B8QU18_9VIBR|nr:phosphorelay protein luxU [Vibrio ishigakensis]GAM77674.1 phosphorelay protein luxU [Vibrio ishigakensis]
MAESYLELTKLEQLKVQVGEAMFPTLLGLFKQELNEYREQLVGGDAEQIGRICHAIKGSAPSFGAKPLTQLATEMDLLFKSGRKEELQQQVPQLLEMLSNTEQGVNKLL